MKVGNSVEELVFENVPQYSCCGCKSDTCRDTDVLFSAPRIGMLPFRFFHPEAQQNQRVVPMKASETNDVLKVSVVFHTEDQLGRFSDQDVFS